MTINLWEVGGQPTSFNPLPRTPYPEITPNLSNDMVISFKARSAVTNARMYVQYGVGATDGFGTWVYLTNNMTEYVFSFTPKNLGKKIIIYDADNANQVEIKDIKIVEKPMGNATINGVDGFLSGKWTLPPNYNIIDDETLEFNATGLNQGGNLEMSVLPNTDYIASIEVGKYAIANMSGVTNGLLGYGEGNRRFNTGNNTKIKFFISNTTTGIGTFVFKRPMIVLGNVPVPYERKRGERMIEPIGKKNMLPPFDGLSKGSLTKVSDYKCTLTTSGNFASGNFTFSVKPYTNYYFKCTHNGNIGIYDTDANTAIQGYTSSQGFTFNSGNRTMARAYLGNGSLGAGTYTFENWQITQGTVGVDFAPYEVETVDRVNNANFDVPISGTGNRFNWGNLMKFNEDRTLKTAMVKAYGAGSVTFMMRTPSSPTPIYQKTFNLADGESTLEFNWKIPKGLFVIGTQETDHVSLARADSLPASFFPRPNNDGSVEVLGGVSTTATIIDPLVRTLNWYFLFNMKFDGANKKNITIPKKNLYKGFISNPFGYTSAIKDIKSEREMIYIPESMNRNAYCMMDVEPNTTYSVSFTAISTTPLNGKMAVYNEDASSNLSNGLYWGVPFTFNSGNRTRVRLYLKNELAIEPVTFKDIQFEKGTTTTYEPYELASKPSRKGLVFDGKYDYIRYQGFADFANKNFTIESTFTWNGANAVDNAQQTIFSCGDVRFGISSVSIKQLGIYTPSSGWVAVTANDLIIGAPIKLKTIFTPTTVIVYINDTLRVTKEYSGAVAPYTSAYIGNLGGGSYFFNGIVHTMKVAIDDKPVIDLDFNKRPAKAFGSNILDKNGVIGTLVGNPTPLNKTSKR